MSSTDYQYLLTSNVTTNLKSLKAVSKQSRVEFDRFGVALAASSHNLKSLVELDISNYFNGTLNLLITILHNLSPLECLKYERVAFFESDKDLDI